MIMHRGEERISTETSKGRWLADFDRFEETLHSLVEMIIIT